MPTREQNERRFSHSTDLPDGGRRYWFDVHGQGSHSVRYIKVVAADETTTLLTQQFRHGDDTRSTRDIRVNISDTAAAITRDRRALVAALLAYLNGASDLQTLSRWAEDALVTLIETDADLPDHMALLYMLGYLSAAGMPHFLLTWDLLTTFFVQLGVAVSVTAR